MTWLIPPLHLRIEVFAKTVTNCAVVRNEMPRSTAEIGSRYGQHDWHYATNRQVAGSIPDDVTGIFQ